MVPLGLPVKQCKPGGGGSVQKHPHMGVSPFEHTLWLWFERNRKDRHTCVFLRDPESSFDQMCLEALAVPGLRVRLAAAAVLGDPAL